MKVCKSKILILNLFFIAFSFNSCEKNKSKEYIINPAINIENCNSSIKIVELSIIVDKDNAFFSIVCETNNINDVLNKDFNLLLFQKESKLFFEENFLNLKELNKVEFELEFSNKSDEQIILNTFLNSYNKEHIYMEFKKIIEKIKITCQGNLICFSEHSNCRLLDRR